MIESIKLTEEQDMRMDQCPDQCWLTRGELEYFWFASLGAGPQVNVKLLTK